jgi:hypothetical protein
LERQLSIIMDLVGMGSEWSGSANRVNS